MTSNNYLTNSQLKIIAVEILNLKIDDLSISQAYDFLYKVQHELSDVTKEKLNEAKR